VLDKITDIHRKFKREEKNYYPDATSSLDLTLKRLNRYIAEAQEAVASSREINESDRELLMSYLNGTRA